VVQSNAELIYGAVNTVNIKKINVMIPSRRSRFLLFQLGSLVSAVSSHSGVWGTAPAEIDFGAF